MASEAQDALTRLNGLLDELDVMYEGSVGDLESRLATVRTAIEKARSSYEGQAAAVAPVRDAGEQDHETLLAAISQNEKRIAELEGVGEKLKAKDARIEELEEELIKCDAAIADSKEKIRGMEERVAQYDGVDVKLTKYEGQIGALEKSIQERDEQIAALKAQIQEFGEGAKERADDAALVEKQAVAAQSEIDSLNAEAQAKGKELHEQRETVASLRLQLQERDGATAKLEETLQQRETEIASLREQLEKAIAESGAGEAPQEQPEENERVKQLEGVLRVKEEDRAKLELEVKMLLGEIEGMRYQRSEIEMLQGKVAKLEKDLAEGRAIIVRLKAQQSTAPRASATPSVREGGEPEMSPTKRVLAASDAGRKGRRAHKQMGEILVEAGVLTEQQLQEVIAFQATDPKRKLGSVVVERGYATEEVISAALAAQLHIRFIENLEGELQPDVIKLVPNHLINNHRCAPLYRDEGRLLVAMTNPLDLIGIENIELATNLQVEVAAAIPAEIDKIIEKYFNRSKAH